MKNWLLILIGIIALTGFFMWLPEPEALSSQSDKQVSSYLSGKTTALKSTAEAVKNTNSIVIKNTTLFDGERWQDNQTLTIRNGIVFSIESSSLQIRSVDSSEKSAIIDGEKQFIIPGLIDAHTHTWGSALSQAVQFGVTTELDMFTAKAFASTRQQERSKFDDTQAADLYSAVTLVTAPGGHGTEYGMKIPTISDPDRANEFVKDRIAEGADYIKIVYDVHHRYYPSINQSVLAAVIKSAHEYQKMAVVHTDNYQSALEAAQAGADGLVHGFFDRPADDQLISALKRSNTFVIPTTTVMASMLGVIDNHSLINDFEAAGIDISKARIGLDTKFSNKENPSKYQAALNNIKALSDAGIVILAGTDAPNPGTSHGMSMHLELAMLVEAGLTPQQAIKSATSNVASAFDLTNRGCLKVGCRADFILLAEDPRLNITATRQIKSVYKNGFMINPAKKAQAGHIELPVGLGTNRNITGIKQVLGKEWVVTTDQMMGGKSEASLTYHASQMRVSGSIMTGFAYPWAGVFLALSQNEGDSFVLPSEAHIQFMFSGTPGQYRLMLFSPLSAMRPLTTDFSATKDSQTISIALNQFDANILSQINGIAIVASPSHKDFEFRLENVILKSAK